ncbi:MAG: ComF family protein [Aquabacterium sp.]|nr:ComF family protein [Aquabacterium sp.]
MVPRLAAWTASHLRSALGGPCLLCREWPARVLCASCHDQATQPLPRCPRCAARVATPGACCAACLLEPPPLDRSVTVADYGHPWNRLIPEFKFQGRVELAAWMARVLADAVSRDGTAMPDWIVPIPLGPKRLRERGYNQAWELARRVARHLGLPGQADVLARLVDTPHQVGASREERHRNLAQALIVEPRWIGPMRGRRVALVDDVVTTGATVAAAARVLRQAGAAEVQAWMLARTPPPAAAHTA